MFEKIIKSLEEKLSIEKEDLDLTKYSIQAASREILAIKAKIAELEMAIKKLKE